MKCPECGRNQKHSDGMRCGGCKYEFVLDPKTGLKLADRGFEAVISRASSKGTAWFTREQLFLSLAKKRHEEARTSRNGALLALFVVLAVVFAVNAFVDSTGARVAATVIGGMLALGLVVGFLRSAAFSPPRRKDFDRAVKAWIEKRGPISMLLEEPRLEAAPDEFDEEELLDHGVERILVVQRDLLVDLFVMNEWHAENRALVLSMTGYPSYLVPVARRLIEETPDLPIFLLHDSDAAGLAMERDLRASGLLPLADREVIDLGITPRDVASLDRLRSIRPDKSQNAIPVDALGYSQLSIGVGAAVAGSLTLETLLAEEAQKRAEAAQHSSFG